MSDQFQGRGGQLAYRAFLLCQARKGIIVGKGLDANQDMSDYAGHLAAEGFVWIGRYINRNKAQPLTHSEAVALSAAGLHIVSLWESGSPTAAGYFTTDRGAAHGQAAVSAAEACGQPQGTPIYFADDYDASVHDITAIADYFLAVRESVRAAGYFVGVYGSGLVCQHLVSLGYVSFSWLAQSKGWSCYEDWLLHAQIVQGPETRWRSCDVDIDTSNGAAGGWQIVITHPPGPEAPGMG